MEVQTPTDGSRQGGPIRILVTWSTPSAANALEKSVLKSLKHGVVEARLRMGNEMTSGTGDQTNSEASGDAISC